MTNILRINKTNFSANFFNFYSVFVTDGWHRRIYFDRMGFDRSIDCHTTDATWKLFIHRIVCVDWRGNADPDHRLFGLLRCTQRIAMHAGHGKSNKNANQINFVPNSAIYFLLCSSSASWWSSWLRKSQLASMHINTGTNCKLWLVSTLRKRFKRITMWATPKPPSLTYSNRRWVTFLYFPFWHVTKPRISILFLVISSLHLQLYCCGADGPLDWKNSKFSNKSGVNLDLSNREAVFKVPRSCCRNTTTLQKCDEFRLNVGTTQLDNSTANVIHTNGCTKTLLKLLNDNLIYILAVLAGIVGVEIIALLIALCLCCAVGDRDDHYKS